MITSATRLVGVVGWPVTHSRSPRMQNAALAALGLDWAYVPLAVHPDRVGAALRGLAALGFVGVNVTIPHKQAVAALCDRLDPAAARSGSVNTVIVEQDASITGDSTDGAAVIGAIRSATGGPGALERGALVIGAGGSALAGAAALADAGCDVTVVARRVEAAREVASALGGRVSAVADIPLSLPGVVVNCTPLGGATAPDATPIGADRLHRDMVVCDLAYQPDGRPTPLCTAAQLAGADVVDGLEVLVRQGALSLERWTGLTAPIHVMRSAARW